MLLTLDGLQRLLFLGLRTSPKPLPQKLVQVVKIASWEFRSSFTSLPIFLQRQGVFVLDSTSKVVQSSIILFDYQSYHIIWNFGRGRISFP